MTLKVTSGHRHCHYSINHDVTTFTVYMTAMTLRSPSLLRRQLKLQAMCAFQFMCKHIIVKYVPHFQRYGTYRGFIEQK